MRFMVGILILERYEISEEYLANNGIDEVLG
jgi:hypothetical protein